MARCSNAANSSPDSIQNKERRTFCGISGPMGGQSDSSGPALVKEIVSSFSRVSPFAPLPLHDYLYLRMAEGMVAMAEESKRRGHSPLRFRAESRTADRRSGTAVDRQLLEGPLPAHEGRVRSGTGLRGKRKRTGL